ncbi:hypothetical protein [Accumulibacter sp.]|uniref:hypothetical protein n=1 Tax=Accumulibacter sp. TaxID=2053492 RepID=UPI0025DB343F|nr:hypothetical protein [Accumulibacter sp.]MCM8594519.1 hypothetical protein [Accumulibacter sp.]MCM8626785.1 hypothetical protein [Accumulibacter sp.]MDS4048665.1 hypothetical protein [Accumulibacter sp.]
MSDALRDRGETVLAIDVAQGLERAELGLPERAGALVILAHAGGSPETRNDALAVILRHAGIGTLTIDLLSVAENRFANVRSNVPLLTRRLLDGLSQVRLRMLLGEVPPLPIGLCASGECSPVALRVAAQRDQDIYAIVCRGGLIDLAGTVYLRALASPLLVLGDANDEPGTASNRRALAEVGCTRRLTIVPGSAAAPASAAVFESVARETACWFVEHLREGARAAD